MSKNSLIGRFLFNSLIFLVSGVFSRLVFLYFLHRGNLTWFKTPWMQIRFHRCKLTTQVWAFPLRQGQNGKSWTNKSQGTSSLNNWKPERQKKQEISSAFCGKTCPEKRNWKKDNPVRIADYATVGSHRFQPFARHEGLKVQTPACNLFTLVIYICINSKF